MSAQSSVYFFAKLTSTKFSHCLESRAVNPDRAAVFSTANTFGHAGEFSGMGKSMIVAPGHRRISISLPGYNTFNTEIDLVPSQKFVLKTDLVKSSNPQMEEPK